MEIALCVPHLAKYDAVGNDIAAMRRILLDADYKVSIFATSCDDGLDLPLIGADAFLKIAESPDNLVIYHHCVYWPYLDEVLPRIAAGFVVRYHNITPAHFYAPYDPVATYATERGTDQTQRLINLNKVGAFLSASEFNGRELLAAGLPSGKSMVLPPFVQLSEFQSTEEDEALRGELNRSKLNLLFVGRTVPNKGHIHLLRTLDRFIERYSGEVKLWIVGSLVAQFEKYYRYLEEFVQERKLGSFVNFVPKANFSQLHTYYNNCQAFLLLSEHEGFCVPILESQAHSLPVVAVDNTAIKETLGKDGLVLERFDYDLLAAAISYLESHSEARQFLVKAGLKNLERYHPEDMSRRFMDVVRQFS